MNMDTIEKWILLEDVGELDFGRRWLLRRALARNPQARVFQRQLKSLTGFVQAEEVGGPHKAVLGAIQEEAERTATKTAPAAEAVFPAWRPALATAGLVLLVVAGWLTFRDPRQAGPLAQPPSRPEAPMETPAALAWDDGLDGDFDALESGLATVHTENGDTSSTGMGDDANSYAEELMQWENSAI